MFTVILSSLLVKISYAVSGSVDMQLLSESTLRGVASMSTVSHFCLQRASACLSVGVLAPCMGQLHTCLGVHWHAVTSWQCWSCCSDTELICSSSYTCSISIPDRGNVIVLSPHQEVAMYLFRYCQYTSGLKEDNWCAEWLCTPNPFLAQESRFFLGLRNI